MPKKKQPPKRRGRPPLSEGEGKRHFVNTRTTKAGKERIELAAKTSGRSVSQEVEFTLERAYLLEDLLGSVFGEKRFASFVLDLQKMSTLIQGHYDKSVWENAEAAHAFQFAIQFLLKNSIHGPPMESIDEFKMRQIKFESKEAKRQEAHWEKLKKETGSTLMGPGVAPPPEGEMLSPIDKAEIFGEVVGTVVVDGHFRELKQAIAGAEKSALAEKAKSAERKDGAKIHKTDKASDPAA